MQDWIRIYHYCYFLVRVNAVKNWQSAIKLTSKEHVYASMWNYTQESYFYYLQNKHSFVISTRFTIHKQCLWGRLHKCGTQKVKFANLVENVTFCSKSKVSLWCVSLNSLTWIGSIGKNKGSQYHHCKMKGFKHFRKRPMQKRVKTI